MNAGLCYCGEAPATRVTEVREPVWSAFGGIRDSVVVQTLKTCPGECTRDAKAYADEWWADSLYNPEAVDDSPYAYGYSDADGGL